MSNNSAFGKDQMKTISIDKKDWMEELELPPKLIRFLRENSRELQIGVAVFVVVLLAVNGYHFFHAKRQEKSTAMLAQAMEQQDDSQRQSALQKVVSEYKSSNAGLWARIELAHQEARNGDQAGAAASLTQVLDELDDDSSIRPFVLYDLANALEADGKREDAVQRYKALANISGYAREGYLGMARVYEQEGNLDAARNAYQQAVDQGGQGSQGGQGTGDWAAAKLKMLAANAPAATAAEATDGAATDQAAAVKPADQAQENKAAVQKEAVKTE